MSKSPESPPFVTPKAGEASRSISPAINCQKSRSPQPYSRRQSSRKRIGHISPSPDTSRAPTPLRAKGYGSSESGTEADDELTRRLPAPSTWALSDKDEHTSNWANNGRGRRKRRGDRVINQSIEKRKRLVIALVRRMVEIGLIGILVFIVLLGREARALSEVLLRRKEILYWLIPYFSMVLAYPPKLILGGHKLRFPSPLDPSALLYPTIFPVLVALSLTSMGEIANPYLATNLVLSLSNLPPAVICSWHLNWLISISPLIPAIGSLTFPFDNNTLTFIAPINIALTESLTGLLYPSLTTSELRLLSSALVNLLFHSSSPQAIILCTLIWGGGIGVFVFCEDVIKCNISLARVPLHRFRRATHTVIGVWRLKKYVGFKSMGWKEKQQASDSEGDTIEIKGTTRTIRKKNFFTSLSPAEARLRKIGYAAAVYLTVLAITLIILRPYIGKMALDDAEPFIWILGYVLCGQNWYQNAVDKISPGAGYCVTDGSTAAANLRFYLIGYWIVILTLGLVTVTTLAPRIEVDTRRKIFHGMIIPMFLVPGLFDPLFTHLCLSVALSLFILIDLIRAGQLPPASGWIAQFLQPYIDGRDLKGPMVVSHVFLLIGVGMGWWLSLAANNQVGWDWQGDLELSFVSGVACVGFGDAAASLIGRRYGKTKWGWRGGKSIEGSIAFTIALIIGLSIPRLWIEGIHGDWGYAIWAKLLTVGIWGSMVEAVVTGINDNVVVPVGVWITLRGLRL